jgi:hypothetical protein
MPTLNETSSLVALRELRDLEACAESEQLRHALEGARSRIEQLQVRLDHAQRAQVEYPAKSPRPTSAQWFGWLGLSAGMTMLVGAVALWAAMRSAEIPKFTVDESRPVCRDVPRTEAREVVVPASTAESPNPAPKPAPHWRRPPSSHSPSVDKPSAVKCDGRDPLCGLDLGAIDDLGRNHGKGSRP